MQLSKTRVEFDSNKSQLRASFYAYSHQLHPGNLAAAQILCAKRGPTKKNGGHNVTSGTGDWNCVRRAAGDDECGECKRASDLCKCRRHLACADRLGGVLRG